MENSCFANEACQATDSPVKMLSKYKVEIDRSVIDGDKLTGEIIFDATCNKLKIQGVISKVQERHLGSSLFKFACLIMKRD